MNQNIKLIHFEIIHSIDVNSSESMCSKKDLLICLCEYSVILLDLEDFKLISKIDLKGEAVKLYIEYFIEGPNEGNEINENEEME